MNIYNNLEPKRKRLLFRARHRGIKEMDYILGRYAEANINNFSDEQLEQLQYIMSFEDRDLFSWFTGEVAIPKELDIPMFYNILNFFSIKLPS